MPDMLVTRSISDAANMPVNVGAPFDWPRVDTGVSTAPSPPQLARMAAHINALEKVFHKVYVVRKRMPILQVQVNLKRSS
jgi:hypothetical protein